MGNYTTAAFVLSLIAGILVLIGGIAVIALTSFVGSILPGLEAFGGMLMAFGAVHVIFGIILLVGSMMIKKPGKQKGWGIVVLVLSIISLLLGGGFYIGAILGIIGGILGIATTTSAPAVKK